jgi:uncharacterized membrane protein (UPF0127 family)/protein-S-isoprenylcysteine O-methyltransferase Ste14
MDVAVRLSNGRTLCERCVLADTALARMRGLLGRKELPSDEGILLRPASSVHTAFMRIPIDVVFLDRDNRVLKIGHSVPPWRALGARNTKAVLELSAGEAERRELQVGDRLEIDGNHDSGMQKRRALPWARAGTNLFLGLLWIMFAAANLTDWKHAHRPVGLGAILLELVIATLFFIRRKPWVTSKVPMAWAATTIGSWGMLAARPAYAPLFDLEAIYFGLQLAGAAAAVYSLSVLGRSFGLVAANRGVRTGGPYGIVRHPLYVSSFVTDLGYTLENPSSWNVFVLFVVIGFQLVRIATEEDCLRGDPAYVRYCERVRYRLVPYVW